MSEIRKGKAVPSELWTADSFSIRWLLGFYKPKCESTYVQIEKRGSKYLEMESYGGESLLHAEDPSYWGYCTVPRPHKAPMWTLINHRPLGFDRAVKRLGLHGENSCITSSGRSWFQMRVGSPKDLPLLEHMRRVALRRLGQLLALANHYPYVDPPEMDEAWRPLPEVKEFYVYVIRAEGIPIYVGKGKGKRCASHLDRPEFQRYDSLTIDILRQTSEKAALVKESELIREFGLYSLINKVQPRI